MHATLQGYIDFMHAALMVGSCGPQGGAAPLRVEHEGGAMDGGERLGSQLPVQLVHRRPLGQGYIHRYTTVATIHSQHYVRGPGL